MVNKECLTCSSTWRAWMHDWNHMERKDTSVGNLKTLWQTAHPTQYNPEFSVAFWSFDLTVLWVKLKILCQEWSVAVTHLNLYAIHHVWRQQTPGTFWQCSTECTKYCKQSPEMENTETITSMFMMMMRVSMKMMIEHAVLMVQLRAVSSCGWVISVWFWVNSSAW